MPPDACSGVGAMRAATASTSSGLTRPERAPSRSTRCTRRAPAADPACRERRRLVGALDHVVVGALVQPNGLRPEDVDRRDHLDPLLEPHVRMLAC